jgi:hypothetical protein
MSIFKKLFGDQSKATTKPPSLTGTKSELIATIEELTQNEQEDWMKMLDRTANTIHTSVRFSMDAVKELLLDAFFDKFPAEVSPRTRAATRDMLPRLGLAMGGASFAKWLAENLVAGRSPAQMIDDPDKFAVWGQA